MEKPNNKKNKNQDRFFLKSLKHKRTSGGITNIIYFILYWRVTIKIIIQKTLSL